MSLRRLVLTSVVGLTIGLGAANTAGAEVAFASRYRDGITRLSARATRNSTAQGVHLGLIMESIAEKLGGEGGGHDGAAGWSGEVDRIAAESAFIHALSCVSRDD